MTLLASMGTFAQAQCDQCGTLPPPPPVADPFVCKVKSNAGVGNGAEGRGSELSDCDPGKSGLHNQAAKNADKPKTLR
jgi:hypothetical protein